MKQKIKSLFIVLIALIFALAVFAPDVKASETQKDLYIVQNRKPSDTAYRINIGGTETDIWKIIEKTNNFDNNIYCIKGGPGFGSSDDNYNSTMAKTYTRRSDMKNVTETLATSFSVLPKDEVVNNIKIKLENESGNLEYQKVSYNNYNAILWLIDNMYLPKLTKLSNDSTVDTANMINEMKDNLLNTVFSKYINKAPGAPSVQDQIGLTDEDIEVVQQLVLWHFTNNSTAPENNIIYNPTAPVSNQRTYGVYDIVTYTDDNTDSTKKIVYQTRIFNYGNSSEEVIKIGNILLKGTSDTTYDGYPMASNRQVYAEMLFTYLVHNAMLHANDYGTGNIRSLTGEQPASFENTTLTFFTQEGRTYVGPFKIIENNSSIPYTLTIPVIKDQNDSPITEYSVYKSNGDGTISEFVTSSNITEDSMKSLVGTEFYISVDQTKNMTGINIELNEKYFETTAEFWMANGSNAEQPVIIIDKKQTKKKLAAGSESTFDLALRKFITAVNGAKLLKTDGKYIREPQPEFVTNYRNSGKDRFVYRHLKDNSPVAVENGDIVTYTIRVYNEGKVDGYAQIVSDDIPAYLNFLPNNQTNIDYGWHVATVNGQNVIQTSYLSKANESNVTGGTLLRAFDSKTMTTPLYKDIEVVFEVTAPNSYKNLVVNTAEITEDADKNGNPIDDIDSIPGNWNLDGDNKEDYNFTEDDIDRDYLKLKIFDLALRKFITDVTNINGATTNNTSVTDGTNLLREPIVNIDSNKKITYTHPKYPVPVHSGERVVYTIRVYNEGETAGYAEEVTDFLPDGTEFIIDDPINVQYKWKLNSTNTKIVSTNYLAFDENDSSKANLLNAFGGTVDTLDYRDLKIAVRVTEPDSTNKEYLENIAEITEDKDKNGNPVDDIDSIPNNKDQETRNTDGSFNEDDTDFERIKLEIFDLALRKFITGVNNTAVTDRYPVPQYVENYNNTGKGRFVYKHKKDESPVIVKNGDIVTYTIRLYNEGKIDGYAQSVYDNIPNGLEYLPENEINKQYGWKLSADGKSLTTDYLSKEKAVDNVILAFNSTTMQTPEYKDVKVALKVVEPNSSTRMIDNTAEIADEGDRNGNTTSKATLNDIDSTPNDRNLDGKDKDHNFTQDDIDKDYIVLRQFDLALRKFITAVNDQEVTTRIPQPTIGENGRIIYIHPKDPIIVTNNSVVTYTIRVYNEGTMDGYAQTISDDVPEWLEYLPENEINKTYGWQLSQDGKTLTTNYLSKEKAVDNLLVAFDKQTMQLPAYKDVKIAFKVTGQKLPESQILINTAEIADDSDKDGNPVDDVDSIPNNKNEEGKDEYHNFKEDDIDKEYVKVQYFDLSLLKWVNKVIVSVDGETTERETGYTPVRGDEGVVKQEIHRKKIDSTIVKFEYTIRITNEGQIAGYAKEISDYIPEGLEFIQEDNPNWTVADGKVTTRALEGTLLQPGETAEVKILLKWINNKENMGVKVNTAEISEDYNDYHVPDIDSTPNNQIPDEDDQDIATVALSTSTGSDNVFYFGIAGIILVAIIGGVLLIKKYVI